MRWRTKVGVLAASIALLGVYWASRRDQGTDNFLMTQERATALPGFPPIESPRGGNASMRIEPIAPPASSTAIATITREIAPGVFDRARTERQIDSTYGKAMLALGLSGEEKEILRAFFIARAQAAYVARDVVNDFDVRSWEVGATGDLARAQVEDEIRRYFGVERYTQIRVLIEGTAYLRLENAELSPAFAKAGVEQFSPEQTLMFADVMAESFGRGIDVIPAKWTDPSTGLTDREVAVLEKALVFLSPEQCAALHQFFIRRNTSRDHR